jgi:subtilisin family serine protease
MPEQAPMEIDPIETPRQLGLGESFLLEVSDHIWVYQARDVFEVTGKGLTAAVLDTGLNMDHLDFSGRIAAARNFTDDYGGDPDKADDGNGHGTNVAGIIVANDVNTGMAPEAKVIPLKVLRNNGGGRFQWVSQALQWVLDNREAHKITVACMSLSDGGNYTADDFGQDPIRGLVRSLRRVRVPVVVAAGNHYFRHQSHQGMSYPAVFRECVSVGAVYDDRTGSHTYGDGAKAFSTRGGQITPFSQRLHRRVNRRTYTDIFAPGAPVTSSGINGEDTFSVQQGTSQATPVTAGVILLMQEYYQRHTGELPSVINLIRWLRQGGFTIKDGDDEDDNVGHTNLDFVRLDALSALNAVRQYLFENALFDHTKSA